MDYIIKLDFILKVILFNINTFTKNFILSYKLCIKLCICFRNFSLSNDTNDVIHPLNINPSAAGQVNFK